MSESTKSTLGWVSLFIVVSTMSSLSIYYIYKDVISISGEMTIDNWGYIRTAIQISVLTLICGFSGGLSIKVNKLENNKVDNSISSWVILFIFGLFPLIILLFYPGIGQLGLHSDKNIMSLVISLSTIQSSLFYITIKLTLKERVRRVNYVLFFIMAIAVILISKFLPGASGGNRYIDY